MSSRLEKDTLLPFLHFLDLGLLTTRKVIFAYYVKYKSEDRLL